MQEMQDLNMQKALNYANEGNFGEAEKLIEEASELINEAHKVQTNMIQMEAAGNKVGVSFLMVHAQDHLMTVMLLRDIVKNFVNLAKKIGQYKKCNWVLKNW